MDICICILDDSMDCETCGGGYAEGGRVHIDGHCVVDMTPVAHCYDSVRYAECEVYEALFAHLGLSAMYSELCLQHPDTCSMAVFNEALDKLGHSVSVTYESLYEPSDWDDESEDLVYIDADDEHSGSAEHAQSGS